MLDSEARPKALEASIWRGKDSLSFQETGPRHLARHYRRADDSAACYVLLSKEVFVAISLALMESLKSLHEAILRRNWVSSMFGFSERTHMAREDMESLLMTYSRCLALPLADA